MGDPLAADNELIVDGFAKSVACAADPITGLTVSGKATTASRGPAWATRITAWPAATT